MPGLYDLYKQSKTQNDGGLFDYYKQSQNTQTHKIEDMKTPKIEVPILDVLPQKPTIDEKFEKLMTDKPISLPKPIPSNTIKLPVSRALGTDTQAKPSIFPSLLKRIDATGYNTLVGAKLGDQDYKEIVSTGSKVGDIAGSLIGGTLGLLTPIPGAGKASLLSDSLQAGKNVLSKIGSKITNPLAQRAIRGAAEGAYVGLGQGIKEGDDAKELAKRVSADTLFGAVLDPAFYSAGKLVPKIRDFLNRGIVERIPQEPALAQVAATKQPTGIYRMKNVQLEDAIRRYNEAVDAIQNHFGTNQLRSEEIPLVKSELGIDIDKLIDDIAKAEQQTPMNTLMNIGKKQRLAHVAGLKEKPLPKLARPERAINEVAATTEMKPLDGIETEIDVIESAKNWRDRPKFLMKRETMIRNFEDIMGKDAPKMKETYLEPVFKAEADRIRFLNKERGEIARLGIKPRSKESALVQKYGEGLITEEELKRQTPKADKIISAAKTIRKKYDEYLDMINQSLVRNGYDPIPKRKDYMRHFQEVGTFLEMYGIPVRENKLPTDINGLTADFRPGKNFFASALRRKGNLTDFDAIQGIDRYIDGASKLIYHTDNIKKLRNLEDTLRKEFKNSTHLSNFVSELREYTNHLAGKKSMMDRAVEDVFGRTAYGILDRMKRQVGTNMVGANISSAATNFIPLTQSLATTDKDAFVKGMYDTIKNVFKNDDFIYKSDFLTRRIGSDPLAMTKWDKLGHKAGWLFKVIDNFAAQTIVRSKYLEGIKKGLDEKTALKQADEWAAKIVADRSLGSMPTLFNSKMLGIFTQFQLEVNNQLSFLLKDIPRNSETKKAMASAITQLFIYSYLFNNLFEKATGRRPAMDPIDIVKKAYEDYTNENLKITQATKNLRKELTDDLPFTSLMSGGRIPLGQAIPNLYDVATGESTIMKEGIKAGYLLSPTGFGQIRKVAQGLTALGKNPILPQGIPGVYGRPVSGNNYLKYPISTDKANIAKGLLFGPSGFRETKDYYRNMVRPLTASQTQKLEKAVKEGQDPQELYRNILKIRELNKLKEEIKNNANLTQKQKENEIKKLNKEIKKLELK